MNNRKISEGKGSKLWIIILLLALILVISALILSIIYKLNSSSPEIEYTINSNQEWKNGDIISKETIIQGGKDENNPIIINIDGKVTIKAGIIIDSGHVIFKGNGSNNELKLDKDASGFISMITVNSNSNLIIDGLILTGNKENSNANLRGLLINGNTNIVNSTIHNFKSKSNGSGVLIANGTNTIESSIIKDNDSQGYGGGIYIENGVNFFKYSAITENSAILNGGGVAINGGTNTLEDSIINKNNSNYGGGIFVTNENSSLKDNTFIKKSSISENISENHGGGIYIDFATVVIEESSIFKNEVNQSGGGIFVDNGVITIGKSNIINNYSKGSGGGITVGVNTKVSIDSGQIKNNIASVKGNDIVLSNNYKNIFSIFGNVNIGEISLGIDQFVNIKSTLQYPIIFIVEFIPEDNITDTVISQGIDNYILNSLDLEKTIVQKENGSPLKGILVNNQIILDNTNVD